MAVQLTHITGLSNSFGIIADTQAAYDRAIAVLTQAGYTVAHEHVEPEYEEWDARIDGLKTIADLKNIRAMVNA